MPLMFSQLVSGNLFAAQGTRCEKLYMTWCFNENCVFTTAQHIHIPLRLTGTYDTTSIKQIQARNPQNNSLIMVYDRCLTMRVLRDICAVYNQYNQFSLRFSRLCWQRKISEARAARDYHQGQHAYVRGSSIIKQYDLFCNRSVIYLGI